MGMTVSCSSGRVALRHDARDHMPDNADPEKSADNVYIMTCDDLEKRFNEIFDQSVSEYNSRQKRSDRVIDNYYEHIEQGKGKEKVCYEYVFQIGNKDDNPVGGENAGISRDILQEFGETFEERNPAFHMVSATIHMDEATPHLHIAFVPVAHGYKGGMRERDSLTKALDNMGFKKEGQTLAVTKWKRAQEDFLESLMLRRGIEREKGNGRKERVEVHEFKEIMKKADAIVKNAEAVAKAVVENAEKQADFIKHSAERDTLVSLQNAHRDLIKLQEDISSLESEKTSLNDNIGALRDEISVLEGKSDIQRMIIKNSDTAIKERKERIGELDAELAEKETLSDIFRKKIDGLKNFYEELKKRPPKEKIIEVERVVEIHKDYKEMAESALNAFFVQNEFIQKNGLSAESKNYGSAYEVPEMANDFLQAVNIVSSGQSNVHDVHRKR